MSFLRLLYVGWLFNLKNLTLSGFFIIVSVISPVIFASMAFLMFRAGARPGSLLFVAIGAGMMGIWSSTLFGSGGAIQWQRWQGTLEYSIAAPPPFIWVVLPLTIATATIGLYSLTSTLLWGWLFFDVPVRSWLTPDGSSSPSRSLCSRSGCSGSSSPPRSCSTGTPTPSATCSSTRSGS